MLSVTAYPKAGRARDPNTEGLLDKALAGLRVMPVAIDPETIDPIFVIMSASGVVTPDANTVHSTRLCAHGGSLGSEGDLTTPLV